MCGMKNLVKTIAAFAALISLSLASECKSASAPASGDPPDMAQKYAAALERIDGMRDELAKKDAEIAGFAKSFDDLSRRYDALGKRFRDMGKRYDAMSKRFKDQAAEFDALGKRFQDQEKRFKSLTEKFQEQEERNKRIAAENKRLQDELARANSIIHLKRDLNALKTRVDTLTNDCGRASVPD